MRKSDRVSFKCHYCGGGRDGMTISAGLPSKSLERSRRIVSAKPVSRSKSVNNSFLASVNSTTEQAYKPGPLLTEDDLREELVQLKRQYGLLTKEHGVLKTHLQVATNDLKKRELEIENLLQDPMTMTKAQEQLELNSLKRKVIQYERAMREKSEEILKLLNDKNVINASENRQKLEKLEKDYEKLKYRLGKSVPQAELEAEKSRLAELIESLQHENNELHQILSTFFQDAENGLFAGDNGFQDTELLEKLRQEAAKRKSEVEQYQKALTALIRDKTHRGTGAIPVHKSLPKQTEPNQQEGKLSKSEKPSVKTIHRGSLVKPPNIPSEKNRKIPSKAVESLAGYKPVKNDSKARKESKGAASKKGLKNDEQESNVKNDPKELLKSNGNHFRKKADSVDETSLGSYVTNNDFDNESNIQAIAHEFHDKVADLDEHARYELQEMEETAETLITAMRCQLLREEMLNTRVMSF
uniref:Uncharacterized protein n=1 Tax=Panagrolaimus sp. JU765 TaxID=591449 RepID=A0AC34QHB2_9BILA